jgi:MoaA/NifB/PqqE/SkfB family radical SAM enzyme
MRRIEVKDQCFKSLTTEAVKENPASGGVFFSQVLNLPAGHRIAWVQIQCVSPRSGARIHVMALSHPDLVCQAQKSIEFDIEKPWETDNIFLELDLQAESTICFRGEVSENVGWCLLRSLTVVEVGAGGVNSEMFYDDIPFPESVIPRLIIFGTTSACNASCAHCPVNKDLLQHFPQGVMPLDLYERIIRELAEIGFSGSVQFGLFGDPLLDPFIVQRLQSIKQYLPKSSSHVSTNCAAFNPEKHARVVQLADSIAVHMEGITPDVYDKYMAPLRASRVFRKIERLLDMKRNNIRIVAPVHKGNLNDVNELKNHWEALGAEETALQATSNRCWLDGIYDEIALAPTAGCCSSHYVVEQMFIDWDGAVMTCCFDFAKAGKIGDLKRESVQEALHNRSRRTVFDIFRKKRWSSLSACNVCRYDHEPTVIEKYINPLLTQPNPVLLPANSFRGVPTANRLHSGPWQVALDDPDGLVIYGPYRKFCAGEYRLSQEIEVTHVSKWRGGQFTCQVTRDNGNCILTEKCFEARSPGRLDCSIEFTLDAATMVEFRIAKKRLGFEYNGAVLTRVG